MKVSKENYKKFCSLLSILSNLTDDIHISGSKITQISNNRSYLMYIDLSPILIDNDIDNLYLYGIENKISILKLFNDTTSDNIDIISDENDKKYIITDGISDISIKFGSIDASRSIFRPDLYKNLEDSSKIVEFDLDKMLLKRFIATGKALDSKLVNISCENGKGSIIFEDLSKNKRMKLISGVDSLIDFKTELNYDCFKTSVGDTAKLTVFRGDSDNKLVISVKTEINGCFAEYRQNRKV